MYDNPLKGCFGIFLIPFALVLAIGRVVYSMGERAYYDIFGWWD